MAINKAKRKNWKFLEGSSWVSLWLGTPTPEILVCRALLRAALVDSRKRQFGRSPYQRVNKLSGPIGKLP